MALKIAGTAVIGDGSQFKQVKGADVASGTILTLGTDGNYFDVTGTTSITSIATLGVGTEVTLHFDDIVILTHHATDLIIPGATNYITSAGDEITFREYASGDWRVVGYALIDGGSMVTTTNITQTLAATTTTTFDLNNYTNFNVSLGVSTTLAFANVVPRIGKSGVIVLIQDGTGGRTITLPASAKTPFGGLAIDQNTTPDTTSILSYFVHEENSILVNYIGNFA